jgi:hypothetical protein
LGIKLDNVKHLALAIAHLNNFCINERLLENGDADPVVKERATVCIRNPAHPHVLYRDSIAPQSANTILVFCRWNPPEN